MKTLKKAIYITCAVAIILCFAGCTVNVNVVLEESSTRENITTTQVSITTQNVVTASSETVTSAPQTTVQQSPQTQTTVDVSTTVISEKKLVINGTRGGVLTFYTDSKTYDLYVPQYYLSTADVPALKALLKLSFMIPDEAKQYVTKENGTDALGPIVLGYQGDTYAVSENMLTFGNTKGCTLKFFPDWGELPFKTQPATATANGLEVTFIVNGGDGKYDCPVATFNLTADDCRALGLTV